MSPLTKVQINLTLGQFTKFHRPDDVPHPPSDRANDAILIANQSSGYQFRHWCEYCEFYSGDPHAPYPGNIPHSTDEHDRLVKDATRKRPLKGSLCDKALTSVEFFNANYQNELVTKMNYRGRKGDEVIQCVTGSHAKWVLLPGCEEVHRLTALQ